MIADGFGAALAFVLRWEGGLVDNPADPGGRTNKGVTQKVYDDWRQQQGVSPRDVELIEDSEVATIYRTSYWVPACCEGLSAPLGLAEFDTAVNMGVKRAIRFLQAAVKCPADGSFGPETQRAVAACDAGVALISYCDERESYYKQLVDRKTELNVFLKGWLNRLDALRQAVGVATEEAASDPDNAGPFMRVPDYGNDSKYDLLSLNELISAADRAVQRLRSLRTEESLQADKALVEQLRDVGRYELMGQLAEAISRLDPQDSRNRRLYGQYLIETGKATAAIDLLQPLVRRLPHTDPELVEAIGLLGRANKQIFFDAGDKTTRNAQRALKASMNAYRRGFELNPKNTWHGVNLLALIANGKRTGVRPPRGLNSVNIAEQIVTALEATPKGERDEWYWPTLAEASLGLDDWTAAESRIRSYVTDSAVKAFQVRSTLRQFTQIWGLELSPQGRGLVSILRARLMELPGGSLEMSTDELQRLRKQPDPEKTQLEAVLGVDGPQTFDWWKMGLKRASSVAAVRRRLGGRVGTGFLVRAGDLGLEPPDEVLFLTNSHVVNEKGASPGIRPQDAEVRFEVADASPAYTVQEIVWSSPSDLCDASVLRLSQPITSLEVLPFADELPALDAHSRVYVIGYPGGRDLAFSFEDNELLDHEGPPGGHPPIPGVCRVHYRAPTEGGSSGSPVFNDRWEVIALHHKGGKVGMPRLNGLEGAYAANEGIYIRLIAGK
jgi:lysozyme family protein/S1-C subfamily serine protease